MKISYDRHLANGKVKRNPNARIDRVKLVFDDYGNLDKVTTVDNILLKFYEVRQEEDLKSNEKKQDIYVFFEGETVKKVTDKQGNQIKFVSEISSEDDSNSLPRMDAKKDIVEDEAA